MPRRPRLCGMPANADRSGIKGVPVWAQWFGSRRQQTGRNQNERLDALASTDEIHCEPVPRAAPAPGCGFVALFPAADGDGERGADSAGAAMTIRSNRSKRRKRSLLAKRVTLLPFVLRLHRFLLFNS